MKKKTAVFTLFLALLYVVLSSDIDGPAHHGHGNITGSTVGAAGHCQTSSCHGGNNALNIVQLQVIDTTTMLPITIYNALQTYLVTISGDATGVTSSLPGFGFQASAVLGNRAQAGTYTIPDSLVGSIHSYPCGTTTIVEQSVVLAPTTTGVNKYTTRFYWTAPPPASDSVKFYTLLNAVNGDGGKGGDYPNSAPVVTIFENPSTATCGVTSGLTHSMITQNSAFLQWSAVAGGITYQVQYRPIGTSTWSSSTATTNSTIISGLTPSTNYEFGVQAVCSGNTGAFTTTSDTFTTLETSAIAGLIIKPNNFSIYPNPATGLSYISYTLSSTCTVTVEVFDITGHKVAQPLVREPQNTGHYEYPIHFSTSGVYFARIIFGDESSIIKFIEN